MTNMPVKAVDIFYSYAHEDESLQKELEKHLSSLRRRNLITTWHDRKIQAGEEWNVQIDKHLSTAQIILLLISPDFLASDYSYGVEVKRAMELHKRGEARVIPIVLRPSEWKGEPYGELQVLPPDGVAVTLWPNKDEAFRLVTEGIQKVVEEISLNTVQEDTALYKLFIMHEQLDPLILRVAWSSDDRYLASVGSEGIVRIWDGRTFTLIKKLHPGNKQVGWLYSLAWSPDVKLLIAAALHPLG
jgi:WD40 repeat protein